MKIREFSERVGEGIATGRLIAYLKDGLEELNIISETDIQTTRIDIEENKRFYDLPPDAIKIVDVRCKNHLNNKDEYRSIPRAIGNVPTKDADGK
tara:strand:+ start:964 stop:1248 length:285 start_codon:yes stop_codon:yes gene_type:complete